MDAPSQKALVLMDNFSGTTNWLQPLDLSTNKAAKDILWEKFQQWYAREVEKQFEAGVVESGVKVNVGMPVSMKEVGAQ